MSVNIDSKSILGKIKENHERINSCKKHAFDFPKDRPLGFGEKLVCLNCGGAMDAIEAFRYCQGFKAAGGNPNEIIENFEAEG